MIESLSDQFIINCLKADYGIEVATLILIPLGADMNAAVYKAQTHDQTAYFVKLKRGHHHDMGIEIVELLHDAGIKEIIPPVKTIVGQSTQEDVVEKCFDDLKNQLDMKCLRMHSSATVDGRLFIQFIALIYISALRKEMRTSGLIERYTVRELLQEMETLTKIKYSGKYGHILSEITKPQREILKGLNIEFPGKT